MSEIIASVAAEGTTVTGVLAAQALRKAATAQGKSIEVEVRTAEGVLNKLNASQTRDASLAVLVGEGAILPEHTAVSRTIRATVDQVLADAAAVLQEAPAAGRKKIVAVTSCPTGIAHTFMAAEGLQQAAKALGHEIRVETQGSVGAQTPLTAEEIAAADLVIIAADKNVELSRFAGKPLFESGTKAAINDGQNLIRRAFKQATAQGGTATVNPAAAPKSGPYKHLMSGVSFMLPFVTAGGLLIALAFAFGGIYATEPAAAHTFAGALFQIGAKAAFTLFVPILGGFIAYSIADRPGLAPGMIGGLLASQIGAGFIGAIAAGFLAGYVTLFLTRVIKLPRAMQGLMPVLVLPLLSSLITGLAMVYVIGTPIADILAFLTNFLKSMQGSSAILLGLLLGGMMAFDMGGPVNKAAYSFGAALLSAQVYTPMAAVMAGGMTPPMAIFLATRLFPSRFTEEEREAAISAGALGLSFITEGAIPFAAKDPFRVIPANVAGSALAGAISMFGGVELKVPHGGVFVLPIPDAVTHLGIYVIAIAAGTLLTALILGVVKPKLNPKAA
ncbi:PTS fructose transporter subunit IIC [Acidocella aromatica]|uniref:protein-N(pi)-phosphohistidine--D-fructose phosphotransferase n=1 Tax=Acidocella aromatica TaxID=1303579 RepID=A0A840VQ58_9PROT|nr:fructose-specific PTS transporter subunit EIIC [Acidocella aromatica]MBB5374249.1 PTS system fructose-specific IIC component [Acidocella aromatica]